MSDHPQPNSDPSIGRPDPASRDDNVPTAKPASASGSARDTFEIVEDRCPKCGIPMPSLAVVCVKCGYDQRANVVREVTTGSVEVAPPPAASPAAEPAGEEFVVPGRLSTQALTIAGGVLTVGALVGAGVWGPRGSVWIVIASLAYVLYVVAVNTVTGVAAVAVAAKMSQKRFGRLDLAAARMFAAFALFQALVSIRYPLGYQVLTAGLPFLVGAAAYFGAIMLLFKKDRHTTTVIALAHFILWLLLQLGPVLAGWMQVAPTLSKPAP